MNKSISWLNTFMRGEEEDMGNSKERVIIIIRIIMMLSYDYSYDYKRKVLACDMVEKYVECEWVVKSMLGDDEM